MGARIYIVEDNSDTRTMLATLIETCCEGVEVCGTAASAEQALDELDAAKVDLVLVDISLPTMSGIDFVRSALARWPQLRCLMLSAHPESMYARRVLALGARGYVAKGDVDQLLEAIPRVLDGGTYLPPRVGGAPGPRDAGPAGRPRRDG